MINKKVIVYIATLSIGVIAGWQLRDILFNQRTDNGGVSANAEPYISAQLETVKSEAPRLEADGANEAINYQAAEQALSVSAFLEKLSQLSNEELNRLMNNKEINAHFSRSPELFDSLLEQMLDISDPKLAARVSQVLSWHLLNNPTLQKQTENLLFEKIKTYDRAPEWLGVLSTWGVHQPDNLVYLADQLDSYSDVSQQTNALSAIASTFAVFNRKASAEEIESLNNSVAPFLSAGEESIRASAVRSLTFLTYPDRDDRVFNALKDTSSKVRIAAMNVVGNQHIKSEEIKSLFISAITDEKRAPLERLTAYQMNTIFALNQSEYEVVYEFATNQAAAVQEQYYAQLRTLRNTKE